MTPEMHERVKELFLRLSVMDQAGRAAALARECADPALRAEVESLLAHHDSRTILETRRRPLDETLIERPRVSTAHRVARVLARDVGDKRWRYALTLLALLTLIAAGVWVERGIRQSLREILRDEIQTVLNADVAALDFWLQERELDAKAWARNRDLRRHAQTLAAIARGAATPRAELLASPALADVREVLDPYLKEEGTGGFMIADRTGLVLAAPADADIGRALNTEGIGALATVFSGRTKVVKPFPQGTFTTDRQLRPELPMIAVAAPLYDEQGAVIAAIGFGTRADDQFTRILRVARLGQSGETYAFDEHGFLLSDSRFTESLKSIGLVPDDPAARAIFNVQVRDPGVDLTRGARPKLPLEARPLTKAAALAIAGQDGFDLDGYRDYRGVKSIGAWRWLPAYGFGVVTEVDHAEAYSPLRYPLLLCWIPLGLLALAAGGLLYSAWRIVRLQRQIGKSRVLGQYTLEEKIGEGGMGVVYRARHAMLQRPTAIKLLKPEICTAAAIARFEREAQLASQLTHPNTIEIYDFGRTSDGLFYYAMEYVAGVSLAELTATEGPIPIARAIHILKQVCGSLREAHAVGLVHRDIKPHNVMLCQRGGEADFVKVLDFGLVKNIDCQDLNNISQAGVLIGTPLYMAPERLQNPQAADPRSDLYAVGAVGYELVTGKRLFDGINEWDVIFHVLNVLPSPPSLFNLDVTPEFDAFVMACLAKDPRKRPQSAQEMLDILNSIELSAPWDQDAAQRWWRDSNLATSRTTSAALVETKRASPETVRDA